MLKKIFVFLFFTFYFFNANANLNFSFTGTLHSISDGDTINVYTGSNINNLFKVRLLGIDTPEKYLGEIKEHKNYGCGVQASHFAKQNIKIGGVYNFYLDNLAKEVDAYGRKLRFLQTGIGDSLTLDNDYGYSILKEGLANFYQYENHSFTGSYQKLDDLNKLMHKGIYNPFCVAQDKYIKENNSRVGGGEISNIIKNEIIKKEIILKTDINTYSDLKDLSNKIIVVDSSKISFQNSSTGSEIGSLKGSGNLVFANITLGSGTTISDDILNSIKNIKDNSYDGVYINIGQFGNGSGQVIFDGISLIREKLGDYFGIILNGGVEIKNISGYNEVVNYIISENLVRKYGIFTQGTDISYFYYQPVENVVDGDIDTYNHTSSLDDENRLQVYIPGLISVAKISVTSRQSNTARLEGAKIYIGNNPFNGDFTNFTDIGTLKGTANEQIFDYDVLKPGKYIVIKALDGKNLHIAELGIYGITEQKPVFNDYKTNYLIAQGYTGALVSTIDAKDYQNDNIAYSLSGANLDFVINNSGSIITTDTIKADTTYNLQVIASDGQNTSITDKITIQTTKTTAIEDALTSGTVDNITEKELINEILNNTQGGGYLEDIINNVFTAFKEKSYDFNWSLCESTDDCSDAVMYNEPKYTISKMQSNFIIIYYKYIKVHDYNKEDIFTSTGYTLDKLLILTADKFRENIIFPMDKLETDGNDFMKSYFADYMVYNYRDIDPAQKDLGNFSRSVFTGVDLITKTITYNSKTPFKSAGVYALPGQTIKITRLDNSDVNVKIFINTLRKGATHEFAKYGYNRPKRLESFHISIGTGEIIKMTNPYGGPIQIEFDKANLPVELKFENVAEHPYWNGPEDDENFTQQINEGKFDWAEISTDNFEVHSKLDKMKESIANWGSAKKLAEATVHYISNFPLVLAAYQGPNIDKISEIWDFAQDNNLEIKFTDTVKHFNADQATCGYGCSGNPYDAYWAFNPISHGDVHEVGHSLERSKFLLDGFERHSTTNPYAYYTLTQYNKEIGNSKTYQTLDFRQLFNIIKQSKIESNPKEFLQEKINNSGDWAIQFMLYNQMMMIAQKYGDLKDGWLLWSRLHLLERNIGNIKSDWENKKQTIGFSNYSLDEFNNVSNNDWMLVSLSFASKLDFRPFFNMYGQTYSLKASEQVESFKFPKAKQTFFIATPSGYVTIDKYGEYLDKPDVEITSDSVWPASIDNCPNGDKSFSKFDGLCEIEQTYSNICYNENWYCDNGTWEKIGKCSGGVEKVGTCDVNSIYRMKYDDFVKLSFIGGLIKHDFDTIYENTSVKWGSTKELIENTPYGKSIKINSVSSKSRDKITIPIDISNAKKKDVLFIEYYVKPLTYDNNFSGATLILNFTNGYLTRYTQSFSKIGEWKHVYFPVYLKDITSDTYDLYIESYKKASFEIAGFSVKNFGDVDYFNVPVSSEEYAGGEDNASWRNDILEKIKQVRTKPIKITIKDKNGNIIKGSNLKIEQLNHSFKIGGTVNWPYWYRNRWNDEEHKTNLEHYFNIMGMMFNDVVFPNSLKWKAKNKETYIDYVFDKTKQYEQTVRGHNIIWPKENTIRTSVISEYNDILADEGEEKANEYLSGKIDDRIEDGIGKYKGKIYEWDVINEPNDGSYILNKFGTGVMLDWLKLARKTAPNLNIAINEYGLTNRVDDDMAPKKLKIIKQLINDNADFDTIGTQTRFYGIMSIESLKQRLELLDELGKEISITETEFGLYDYDTQAKLFKDLTLLILADSNVRSIDYWSWFQHKSDDFYGLKAFYTKDNYAKPIVKEFYNLFYKQFWVDKDIALNSGEYKFNPFFGEYKLVGSYDGKEIIKVVNIQKNDNKNEYVLNLDLEIIPLCKEENWTCSSSCGGTWVKIETCSSGIEKKGSCSSSCGGGSSGGVGSSGGRGTSSSGGRGSSGGGFSYIKKYDKVKKVEVPLEVTKDNFDSNIYYKDLLGYKIIQYKESKYNNEIYKLGEKIKNSNYYNYEKKILIKDLNKLGYNLYGYRIKNISKELKSKFSLDLKKYYEIFISDYKIVRKKKNRKENSFKKVVKDNSLKKVVKDNSLKKVVKDNFDSNIYYKDLLGYKIIQYKESKYNNKIYKIGKKIEKSRYYSYEKKILIKDLNKLGYNLYGYTISNISKELKYKFLLDLKKYYKKFISDYKVIKNRRKK